MNKSRLVVLLFGFGLLTSAFLEPGSVFGQGHTWPGDSLAQMLDAARWRLGILRVNSALLLANAGYDSDIYYGYAGEAVDDFTFSASIPTQFLIPVSKSVVLNVEESPQYLFYLDSTNERAWNNVFRGSIHLLFGKYYLQAGGGLSNVRQRLSPELDINVRERESSLSGLALWQASRKLSFALLVDNAKFDYGEMEYEGTILAEQLNRQETFADFVSYLQPSQKIRFFLDGQYGTFVFTEPQWAIRNTRSYAVYAGFELIPRTAEAGRTSGPQGSLSLGYKSFDVMDPSSLDGSGLAGAIDISVGLFARTTGHASFSKDFEFSAFSGRTFYTSTGYGAGISRQVSRRLDLSYDFFFGQISYPEAEPDGGTPPGADFRFNTHIFRMNLSLARHLELTLMADLGRRLPEDSAASISRNFFGISLIYGTLPGAIAAPTRVIAP